MSTILVTGANRGIGLELTRQLAARGDDLIATCRSSSPELDALGVRVETGVDVGDDDSVAALAKRLDGVDIDVLINNAGVLTVEGLDSLDIDRIRRQFEINAVGPLRITRALLDKLGRGAKVVMITSRMGSIADNTSGGAYGYRMSKAALNMAGMSLAQDLRKREISVTILHPGMVATDMTAGFGHGPMTQSPKESAAKLVARIDEASMATTGHFFHANGEPLPW